MKSNKRQLESHEYFSKEQIDQLGRDRRMMNECYKEAEPTI